jgi:hypothetical protein
MELHQGALQLACPQSGGTVATLRLPPQRAQGPED